MPHLKLITNVTRDKIPKNFARELLSVIAKSLGKAEEKCVVSILPDQIMAHGTEEGPCGQATLMSVGKLGEVENVGHSKAISEKIRELGIPPNRLYITFYDTLSYNVGVNGGTAKSLYGE